MGLVHIYFGDGKGKTTAAAGLAIRCAGGGGKVVFASFLKDENSGERTILEKIENIKLVKNPETMGFYKFMDEKEKDECRNNCRRSFDTVKKYTEESKPDMVILDEIIPVIKNGLLEESELLEFLNSRPDNTEIVMTGREPSEKLLETADYVTEMRKIKHPFDLGIKARRFIEM